MLSASYRLTLKGLDAESGCWVLAQADARSSPATRSSGRTAPCCRRQGAERLSVAALRSFWTMVGTDDELIVEFALPG